MARSWQGWGLLIMIFGWQMSFFHGLCGALLASGYIVYDTWQAPPPPHSLSLLSLSHTHTCTH